MFSRRKFKEIKSLINLSLARVDNIRKKTNQELSTKKRVLAKNLQEHEFALARLEAERIVKLDWKVEAMNILQIKCEEIRDNVPILDTQKTVPPELEEAVASVIYAENRAGVPELKNVVRVLERKYGQEFIKMQGNNGSQRVEPRLIHRLSGERPNAYLVYNYMKEIAADFGIEFIDDEVTRKLGERFDVPMSAGTAGVSSASGIGTAAYEVTDGRILPPGKKPAGYTPPTFDEADFQNNKPGNGDAPDQSTLPKMGGDDDDQNNSGGGSGGGAPAAKPAPKPQQKKPTQRATKPVPKSKGPLPKPKPKHDDGGMGDLLARFNKLQDL